MPDLALVLLVILGVVLVWRGPKTLPRIGEALGRGVRAARSEAAKGNVEDGTTNRTDRPDRPA
jgi:Sec-independent protein translocase protein TatA